MPASPFHQKLFYLGKNLVSAGSKATSQTNLHEKMRIYFEVKIHRKKAEGRQQEGRGWVWGEGEGEGEPTLPSRRGLGTAEAVQLQCKCPVLTPTMCDTTSETWIHCPVETGKALISL